ASPPFRAMKYNTTQPSTEPSAARNAYSGILAGCCMDNSISNKSLMIGNVSTEESRKEIRKSPGAPSPPANATIFCFHPFKLVAKRNSSHPFAAICLGGASDLGADGRCQRAFIAQKPRDRNDS